MSWHVRKSQQNDQTKQILMTVQLTFDYTTRAGKVSSFFVSLYKAQPNEEKPRLQKNRMVAL